MPRLSKKMADAVNPTQVDPDDFNDAEEAPTPETNTEVVTLSQADLALARATAVILSVQPPSFAHGSLVRERAIAQDKWDSLVEEERRITAQMLSLKEKENQVLSLVRDRIAGNLISTIDKAIEEGHLAPTPEV